MALSRSPRPRRLPSRTAALTAVISALAVGLAAGPLSPAPARADTRTASTRSIEGTVERVVVDPPDRRAQAPEPHPEREVVTVRGRHGQVIVPAPLTAGLRTGERVRVTVSAPSTTASEAPGTPVEALVRSHAARVTRVEAIAPPNTVNVRGTHRMLVVPVTWGTSRPWTTDPAAIRSALKPTDDYWSRVSNGRIRVDYAGAVVTSPMAATRPTSCEDWDRFSEMDYQARSKLGTSFHDTQYHHVVLLLPPMEGCWGGLANVGGYSPYAQTIWLNNDTSDRVVAHELGHNLGLNHSGLYTCYEPDWAVVPLSSRCVQSTYADPFDLMGGSWSYLGSISATHMDQLGLLTPAGVQTVQNVNRRRYTLRRLTAATTEDTLRGLVVPALSGQLLVEYRTATGQDSWISTGTDDASPGVLLRGVGLGAAPMEDPVEEDLLRPSIDPVRTSWHPGDTLTVPGGKAAVSVVSEGTESAVVEVTQDTVAPTPTFAPSMLVRGGPISTASVPATMMWGTATDGPGVGVQNLLASPAPGAPPRVLAASETRSPVRLPLGSPVSMGLRLNDKVGNTRVVSTAPVTPRVDPLSVWTSGWSSGWTPVSGPSAFYGGSERQTSRAGASVSFTVTARSVGLVATKGETRGRFAMSVDGVSAGTVDLGHPTPLYQNVVWSKSWPRTGTHTVTLVNLAEPGRPTVGVDALVTLG